MPIQKTPGGGTVSTGYGVKVHSLLTQKRMIMLEQKGLKHSSGHSMAKSAIWQLTGEMPNRATEAVKRRALELVQAEIDRLAPVVAEENRLGRCLSEQEAILILEADPED